MNNTKVTKITINALIDAPAEKVWEWWNDPQCVTKWNQASDDWHSPSGENDLRKGGRFTYRMEAKDGSMGFDFSGIYGEIKLHEKISYTLDDGRKVDVIFSQQGKSTHIRETFEAESTHSIEMQQNGWQAILDSFKRFAENEQ